MVYGRRVGEARLLQEAAGAGPAVYFQATRVALSLNLKDFAAQIAEALGPDPVLDAQLAGRRAPPRGGRPGLGLVSL